jgi:hypothetical protein
MTQLHWHVFGQLVEISQIGSIWFWSKRYKNFTLVPNSVNSLYVLVYLPLFIVFFNSISLGPYILSLNQIKLVKALITAPHNDYVTL